MNDNQLLPSLIVVACGALVLFLATWALIGNRLVRLRNQVLNSWADVDAALKRRYELIPPLIESVKAYARYESELMSKVIELRTRAINSTGQVDRQAEDEELMVESMNQFLAAIEKYPELKASGRFLQLQHELVNTEDRIAAARRYYNATVRDFNAAIASFPSRVVASNRGLVPAPYFEVQDLAIRNYSPTLSASGEQG